ncbi:alpha/beta hydrolase [Bounagaea algeriensis]
MFRAPTVLATALLTVTTAACVPQQPDTNVPHTERNGPAGPVPQGLERFYGQSLRWQACPQYAETEQDRQAYAAPGLECARLTVPLDYSDPGGDTVQLGLLRRPATGGQDERIGSLMMNPGGPGASGMSAAAGMAGAVSGSELGERFDFVGFDPRGVGASEPAVQCLTDAERDAERLDSDADASPRGVAQTEREERAYARKCAERSGSDLLANIGTDDVAKDLDVLRSALGDNELNYLGFSYGTRIGSEYAEQFPGNVRTMLLDGAIDPQQSTTESLVGQGDGFQRAFADFARWCADRGECALGDDPSRAVAEFQRLTRPLVDSPVPVGDRALSYDDATTAVIQALYAPDMWEQLNQGLMQLRRGQGRVLLALADVYYGRDPDGSYSNTIDAFDAIHCVDDERLSSREEAREADRRYREAAPFLDDGRVANPARDMCSFWPVPPSGDTEQPQVRDLPPTLVVSTTGDPATPYQAGVRLARALHGRLLTYEGTQHTAFLQGDSCVDEAGVDYFVDRELPEEGTRCG